MLQSLVDAPACAHRTNRPKRTHTPCLPRGRAPTAPSPGEAAPNARRLKRCRFPELAVQTVREHGVGIRWLSKKQVKLCVLPAHSESCVSVRCAVWVGGGKLCATELKIGGDDSPRNSCTVQNRYGDVQTDVGTGLHGVIV